MSSSLETVREAIKVAAEDIFKDIENELNGLSNEVEGTVSISVDYNADVEHDETIWTVSAEGQIAIEPDSNSDNNEPVWSTDIGEISDGSWSNSNWEKAFSDAIAALADVEADWKKELGQD